MTRIFRVRTFRALSSLALLAVLAMNSASVVAQGPTGFESPNGPAGFQAPTATAVKVTTLADYNPATEAPIPGSLRHAVEKVSGARTITFNVGGEILLKAKLIISTPFVTIDGSTAPDPGITIERIQVEVYNTHDVTLRNLRFRCGDGFATDAERQAMHGDYTGPYGGWRSLCIWAENGALTYSVTVENCSIQSSTDDNATVWGNCRKIEFRRCLFSGGHFSHKQMCAGWPAGTDPVFYSDWLTIDSCVFTGGPHAPTELEGQRMPDARGGTLTLTHNIVVWPHQGSRFTTAHLNVIGNWFVENPNHPWGASRDRVVTVTATPENASIFVSGNYLNGEPIANNRLFGFPNLAQTDIPSSAYKNSKWNVWPQSTDVSSDMNSRKLDVIARAGCVLPVRDAMDLATIEDTRAKVSPVCPPSVNGDMNGDGLVNGGDLQAFVNAALCGSTAPGTICRGDFNHNGRIDSDDVTGLMQAMGM